MVLVIGVAVVGVSMGKGLWEWAVYSDWELDSWPLLTHPVPFYKGPRLEAATTATTFKQFQASIHENLLYKVKRKRWSWVPGPEKLRKETSEDEYESMLEERNRRAKGGQ